MACAVQRVVGARGVLPHPQSMGLDDYTMRMIRTLCLAGGRSVGTPSLLSPDALHGLREKSVRAVSPLLPEEHTCDRVDIRVPVGGAGEPGWR